LSCFYRTRLRAINIDKHKVAASTSLDLCTGARGLLQLGEQQHPSLGNVLTSQQVAVVYFRVHFTCFVAICCMVRTKVTNTALLSYSTAMDLPTTNDRYAMKDYWDERYTEEADYDWFAKYDWFAHHIARTINRSDRILQLGTSVRSLQCLLMRNKPKIICGPSADILYDRPRKLRSRASDLTINIGVASYVALGHVPPPPRLPASYFGDHSLYRL